MNGFWIFGASEMANRYLKVTSLEGREIVCDLDETANLVLRVFAYAVKAKRAPVEFQQRRVQRDDQRRRRYVMAFRDNVDAELFDRDLRIAYAKAKRTPKGEVTCPNTSTSS
jgi:hypothetical protein